MAVGGRVQGSLFRGCIWELMKKLVPKTVFLIRKMNSSLHPKRLQKGLGFLVFWLVLSRECGNEGPIYIYMYVGPLCVI